jgi:hypothetical protein
VPTPYRGLIDLGHVILRAEIDDIDSPTWRGLIQERPVAGLIRGPVTVRLFDRSSARRLAKAEAFIGDDQTVVLHGAEPFRLSGADWASPTRRTEVL